MAKMYGLELKAGFVETCEDDSVMKVCGLYLGATRIATVIYIRSVPDADNSVQVFVKYPYSEKKLRKAVEELRPGQDYSLDAMLEELEWMDGMEHEFKSHLNSSNSGMLALNFEGGQVTMGIPLKFSESSEEEILSSCQKKIEEFSEEYGELKGYRIFHNTDEFQQGDPLNLKDITKQ